MRYTVIYSYRQVHPWWKFWLVRKFTVFRINQEHYQLGLHTRQNAFDYANMLNQLGS